MNMRKVFKSQLLTDCSPRTLAYYKSIPVNRESNLIFSHRRIPRISKIKNLTRSCQSYLFWNNGNTFSYASFYLKIPVFSLKLYSRLFCFLSRFRAERKTKLKSTRNWQRNFSGWANFLFTSILTTSLVASWLANSN